ncbi:MAG: hypothetical protein ABEL04_00725 [Salinibacter sp.]|uniref:hypothetical protein n=1 Tax=Salinibacter sp. TaxID=2065818 RepID=UPI0035D4009B
MKQTLLALVALLIATFLSFNQKQARMQSQGQVVRAEMQQMALGVAAQTLQVIRARDFDDATEGVPRDSIVPTSAFTEAPFSTGNDCQAFGGSDACDDVDDFHEMQTASIPFTFPTGKFDFDVDVRVRYVDPDLQSTGGSRSSRKQVIVEVQDDPSSGSPRLPEPIEYSEVISYP